MDEGEFQARKAIVEAAMAEWIPVLGLGYWVITNEYHHGPYVDNKGTVSADRRASAEADWRYMTAMIRWDLSGELRTGELEMVTVHELVHCMLDEVWREENDGSNHTERVTTMLEKAFLRLRSSRDD